MPSRRRRVLYVLQGLPAPFDRRAWLHATTLARNGYAVSFICPKGRGYNAPLCRICSPPMMRPGPRCAAPRRRRDADRQPQPLIFARLLPPETLKFLRLLSNFETDREKLVQTVPVGQPELDNTLARRDMRQVNQRVALRARLAPLSLGDAPRRARSTFSPTMC